MGRRVETDPAEEAWVLLFQLAFSVNMPRIAATAQEFGLAKMQLHALRLMEPGGELPMSALAETLVCDASNVTGIVDRLEARGLIERRPAAHDRRVKMIALTPEGELLREQLIARMTEPPPVIASLSRADQRALRDLLRKALARDAPAAGVPPGTPAVGAEVR